jgi:hypothetical protein
MPGSPDAQRSLAAARDALAHGAFPRATEHAWASAVAAVRVGDETTLEALAELTTTLAEQVSAAKHEEADQLRRYVALCLEDTRNGTRPHSAFERLLGWNKPSR